eukprot:CAMPEP_0172366100 /NCGR_PEP_ID=MMETSP1060-20121228/13557_1 /TAXON_ID=37318 /ORGANISM="Pseudo-nitzschia pungens, Strain cf. cingulata" /LENGTH=618 /DNA_ID=CAMNT_0013089817 /DNA_START=121 /DNA_END=1980 /DNA_ORIENTATION=-
MTIRRNHLLLVALLCATASLLPNANANAETCMTNGDCPDENYCNALGECLLIGSCDGPADCNDPSNSPYPIALCNGLLECREGTCSMDCDQVPPDETPLNLGAGAACDEITPCADRDTYCSSDGTCKGIGSCAAVEDCRLDSNKGYPIAACIGTMGCREGTCAMNCTETDAKSSCASTSDCNTSAGEYCSIDRVCREAGSCTYVEDCGNTDNLYAMIECVGTTICEDQMCGIVCDGDGDGDREVLPPTCASSADCPREDSYCASDNVCREAGSCNVLEDCDNMDNIYPVALCFGSTTCENNLCGQVCDGSDAIGGGGGCTASSDCDSRTDEYCDSNGICRQPGTCSAMEDCLNRENSFMMAACVGTVTCDGNHQCGKICDGGGGGGDDAIVPVPLPGSPNGPVVVLEPSCTTDADCMEILPMKRAAADSGDGDAVPSHYCSRGTCRAFGSCSDDSDCHNPANLLIHDKRCAGYLTCLVGEGVGEGVGVGVCDRICGEECKNGARPFDCVGNPPCDSDDEAGEGKEWCPGAVSCVANFCDGECGAIYFDAAGAVLENCGGSGGGGRGAGPDAGTGGDDSRDGGSVSAAGSGSGGAATTAATALSLVLSGVVIQAMVLCY